MPDLLTVTDRGLYCAVGDFYIDPLRVVSRAVITHAHSDHAKPGMGKYFCAAPGTNVLQTRMRKNAVIHPLNVRCGSIDQRRKCDALSGRTHSRLCTSTRRTPRRSLGGQRQL